ncbi:hypothetical protein H9Q74_000426 [Fusarium xylarioides]|nr:hypothetical protein H9Q74_000426 [Fusarium xylarioides]
MHLPLGQKLAVMALFGFGALVCVLTILVIHNSFEFNGSSKEIALKIGHHGSLAAAECNLANVSVSLPMLRPVFRKIVPSSFLASHRSKRAVVAQPYHQNTALRAVAAPKHQCRTAQVQYANL